MTKVLAGITTSVDGYITGPDDGPGEGPGEGGERRHYWVFVGPWTYEAEPKGEPTGEDAAWLAETISTDRRCCRRTEHVRGCEALGRREPLGTAVLHRDAPARGGAGR